MYRENWEVLSKNATEFLAKNLNPCVAFSGHSHHYCRTISEEYTAASVHHSVGAIKTIRVSFWYGRSAYHLILITLINIIDSIFQAEFKGSKYAVTKCDMPVESTVIFIYIATAILYLTYFITVFALRCFRREKSQKVL